MRMKGYPDTMYIFFEYDYGQKLKGNDLCIQGE